MTPTLADSIETMRKLHAACTDRNDTRYGALTRGELRRLRIVILAAEVELEWQQVRKGE